MLMAGALFAVGAYEQGFVLFDMVKRFDACGLKQVSEAYCDYVSAKLDPLHTCLLPSPWVAKEDAEISQRFTSEEFLEQLRANIFDDLDNLGPYVGKSSRLFAMVCR